MKTETSRSRDVSGRVVSRPDRSIKTRTFGMAASLGRTSRLGTLLVLALLAATNLLGVSANGQLCPVPTPLSGGIPEVSLSGIVNSYYPPNQASLPGDGILVAGSTSVVLAAARTGVDPVDGATITPQNIAVGDLLMVMQMQDADFNNTNDNNYGANNGTGTGSTNLNRSGQFEYVRATSTVTTAGGTLTFSPALTNSYRNLNATASTQQRRFQVIRVPEYERVGIDGGNGLTGASWNGSTGGVLAIEVINLINFSDPNNGNIPGVISMDFKGFRGGGGRRVTGTTTGPPTAADFLFTSPTTTGTGALAGAHGIKGESVVGSPSLVYNSAQVIQHSALQGYPGGASGQGAPGNGGGGGTDANPAVASPSGNTENSGGGGGGNAGAGGFGGNTGPTVNNSTGGRGGASMSGSISTTRVFMGGGGGAGVKNDSTNATTSSGGVGGGIVIIHVCEAIGSATITASGDGGVNSNTNDGGGGAGAGGSILLFANTTTGLTGLTIRANGGNGGNNTPLTATDSIGPGGGGGGGVVFTNFSTGVTTSATGGNPGGTNPGGNTTYGATAGAAGLTNTAASTRGTFCTCATPTEVKLADFQAIQYADGQVGVNWSTGFEADNLGFRVWKETRFGRQLVTPDIIAGNALMAGTTLTAGNRYNWRDSLPNPEPIRTVAKRTIRGRTVFEQTGATVNTPVTYWLEDIDLNGKSTWSGPFKLQTANTRMPEAMRNAPLLGRNNPLRGAQTVKALASTDPAELSNAITEATANRSARSKSASTNNALANAAAVKLGVRTTGWQRVSRSALVTAGLNPSAVDANLKLFVGGQEVPIRVSANSVEFYGVAADTLQSGEQTYWLVEGTNAGLRIPTQPFTGGSKIGVANFPSLIERRDRTTYFAALQNGDEDNFFGAVVSNSAVDQAVTVKDRDAGAATPAQVAVTLQGVSLNNHRVTVKLNGQAIGEVTYNGRDQQTFIASVPQSQLLEGQNTVTLQSADGGDVNLVAAVRVNYARSFIADADALSLSGRAGQTLTVRGFSQAPRVFDVTDPMNPVEVTVRADGAGTGNVSASFVAPGTAKSNRVLVAATENRFVTPTVTANTPSTLSATSNAADFVIITTPELAPALTPLVQLRQSQGLNVKVVDVTDIYDEFNFGVKSTQAIKDFLNLASHNWQTPVRYVMLAGDASFDPRDFLGFNQDVIPTKLIGLGTLETASDDWFVDFEDNGLSQVAMGRLPGRSATEIGAMVSKIVAYDQANGQSWQRESLIVADNNDEGGNFEAAADSIETELPGSFAKTSVKIGQIGGPASRTQVLNALNSGKGFVNYSGHGSVSNWAAENILISGDVANLTNTGRASLVVSMTCLNGFFHDVFTQPLGKELVKASDRGAVASWSSSALTPAYSQNGMNQALVRALFGPNPAPRLGDAIRQAKASTENTVVRRAMVLIGDPTLRVTR
jgi:hypothetical protein